MWHLFCLCTYLVPAELLSERGDQFTLKNARNVNFPSLLKCMKQDSKLEAARNIKKMDGKVNDGLHSALLELFL